MEYVLMTIYRISTLLVPYIVKNKNSASHILSNHGSINVQILLQCTLY